MISHRGRQLFGLAAGFWKSHPSSLIFRCVSLGGFFFSIAANQTEFLQLVAQGVAADVEQFGGVGLVAIGLGAWRVLSCNATATTESAAESFQGESRHQPHTSRAGVPPPSCSLLWPS